MDRKVMKSTLTVFFIQKEGEKHGKGESEVVQ
jgi:hypothetical protein